MRPAAIALALSVVAALATASVSRAEPPDPCALVTPKDAVPVFSATPPAGKRATMGAIRSCTYTVKHKTLTVETRALASVSAFVASTKNGHGLVLPIAGMTDAYSADGGTEMLLWKKGVEITVSFGGLNPVFAVQQSLANAALGRV